MRDIWETYRGVVASIKTERYLNDERAQQGHGNQQQMHSGSKLLIRVEAVSG